MCSIVTSSFLGTSSCTESHQSRVYFYETHAFGRVYNNYNNKIIKKKKKSVILSQKKTLMLLSDILHY